MGGRISIELESEMADSGASRQLERRVKRVMAVINCELVHRWELGQIRRGDRLMEYLVFCSGLPLVLENYIDLEYKDLKGSSSTELGNTIHAVTRVLLASSGLVAASAIVGRRRGFCEAFDGLRFELRKEAVRVAHGMARGVVGASTDIARGFPVVEPDTISPGCYIAYRYGHRRFCGHGESDLKALIDLERRERGRSPRTRMSRGHRPISTPGQRSQNQHGSLQTILRLTNSEAPP